MNRRISHTAKAMMPAQTAIKINSVTICMVSALFMVFPPYRIDPVSTGYFSLFFPIIRTLVTIDSASALFLLGFSAPVSDYVYASIRI